MKLTLDSYFFYCWYTSNSIENPACITLSRFPHVLSHTHSRFLTQYNPPHLSTLPLSLLIKKENKNNLKKGLFLFPKMLTHFNIYSLCTKGKAEEISLTHLTITHLSFSKNAKTVHHLQPLFPPPHSSSSLHRLNTTSIFHC